MENMNEPKKISDTVVQLQINKENDKDEEKVEANPSDGSPLKELLFNKKSVSSCTIESAVSSSTIETSVSSSIIDTESVSSSTSSTSNTFLKAMLNVKKYSNTCYGYLREMSALEPSEITDSNRLALLNENVVLKDYQKDGITWLYNACSLNMTGAILADEMGLGKTIQSIGFICKYIEFSEESCKPILIVCPLSVMENWKSEFGKFAPKFNLITYHGDKTRRAIAKKQFAKVKSIVVNGKRLKMPCVVISTYQVVQRDRDVLDKIQWGIIIIDEGQKIKSSKSKISKAMYSFQSHFRLLLTGTPLQNNIEELWTLLHFTHPDIFNNFENFKNQITVSDFMDQDTVKDKKIKLLNTIHEILKPYFLRRLKKDVNLNLPQKKISIIYCPMTDKQTILYKNTINKSIGTNIFEIKLEQFEEDQAVEEQINIVQSDEEEVVEECSDSDNINDKKELLISRKRKRDGSDLFVPHPKRKRMSKTSTRKSTEDDPFHDDPTSSTASTNLRRSTRARKSKITDFEMKWLDSDKGIQEKLKKDEEDAKKQEEKKIVKEEIMTNIKMANPFMQLKKIANHPYLVEMPIERIENDKKVMKVNEEIIKKSGKMIVLNQLLTKLREENHKTLIFCTMTSMLDVIQEMCIFSNYKHYRLDGTISSADRLKSCTQFNNEEDWSVFLISTRAGGLGLNLVAADTCILFDSDWNPQVDIQAQDRCHRIGQTKPVLVFRLVTTGTIEQKIIDLQQSKLTFEKIILHEDLFKYENLKTKDDIKNKFNIYDLKQLLDDASHSDKIINPQGNILSDSEIMEFLDRSEMK